MSDNQYDDVITRLDNQETHIRTLTESVEQIKVNADNAAAAATSAATSAVNAAEAAAASTAVVTETHKVLNDIIAHTENRYTEMRAEFDARNKEMVDRVDQRFNELLKQIDKQQDETQSAREKVMVAVLNAFMLQTNRCNAAIAQGNIDILKQVLSVA